MTSGTVKQPAAGAHHGSIDAIRNVGAVKIIDTTYARDFRTALHSHDRACFVVILAGGYVEHFARCSLTCERGTIVFRPAGAMHRDELGRLGTRCLIAELPDNFHTELGVQARRLDSPVRFDDRPDLVFRIAQEWDSNDDLSPLVLQGLLLEVAGQSIRCASAKRGPQWITRAENLLRDGFLAPVRLETLARELDVHPSHLARSFRESHGCTVGEYVRQLRVARAAELLKSTSASILEIALATGFADQAHLSTVFRKWMGTSPGRYRKLLHGECKNPKTAQDS